MLDQKRVLNDESGPKKQQKSINFLQQNCMSDWVIKSEPICLYKDVMIDQRKLMFERKEKNILNCLFPMHSNSVL